MSMTHHWSLLFGDVHHWHFQAKSYENLVRQTRFFPRWKHTHLSWHRRSHWMWDRRHRMWHHVWHRMWNRMWQPMMAWSLQRCSKVSNHWWYMMIPWNCLLCTSQHFEKFRSMKMAWILKNVKSLSAHNILLISTEKLGLEDIVTQHSRPGNACGIIIGGIWGLERW